MLNLALTVSKMVILVFWLAFVLSLASVVPGTYGQIITWVGVLVLVLHCVEYLAIRGGIIVLEGGEAGFVQTLLFGFTHWLPLVRRDRDT